MKYIKHQETQKRRAMRTVLILLVSLLTIQCRDDFYPDPSVRLKLYGDETFAIDKNSSITSTGAPKLLVGIDTAAGKDLYLPVNTTSDSTQYIIRTSYRTDTLLLKYTTKLVYHKNAEQYVPEISDMKIGYHTFDSVTARTLPSNTSYPSIFDENEFPFNIYY